MSICLFQQVRIPTHPVARSDDMVRHSGLSGHPEVTLEHVYVGDTTLVWGVKIRLNGLHATEWDAPDGRAAINFMRSIYGGTPLNGDRSRDRLIGVCYGPGGEDIAAAAVAAGAVREGPRYSGGRYRKFEAGASRRHRLPGDCR